MNSKMLSHLVELDNSSTHIIASALIAIDGLIMATTFPVDDDMNIDHFGALCAGAFSFGHSASEKCAAGILEQITIKFSKNKIIITHVDKEAMLAISIQSCANIEQITPAIKHFAAKIATELN